MIPTTTWEKDILIGASLGEKKKVLENVDCDAEEFKEVLITHFPKLVDAGGISYVNARLIHKISNHCQQWFCHLEEPCKDVGVTSELASGLCSVILT